MRLELYIDPASCDLDLLTEVASDSRYTEYGIALEDMQTYVLNNGGLWPDADTDLINASKLAPGARFVLTCWSDDPPYRRVYMNGHMFRLVPFIKWVAE